MVYEVQLDSFQGPLELLYKLVKKNEIEINEISLAEITDQFLEYTDHFQSFDLDLASEFMVIASELIELKASYLLPEDETKDDADNESDLVNRLQEYHVFKKISKTLKKHQKEGNKIYFRPIGISNLIKDENELELEIKIKELKQALIQAVTSEKNEVEEEEDKDKSVPEQLNYIEQENFKVEDKIDTVMDLINDSSTMINFYHFIGNKDNSLEVVVTLLSVLELMKLKKIKVFQDGLFSEIKIFQESKKG